MSLFIRNSDPVKSMLGLLGILKKGSLLASIMAIWHKPESFVKREPQLGKMFLSDWLVDKPGNIFLINN